MDCRLGKYEQNYFQLSMEFTLLCINYTIEGKLLHLDKPQSSHPGNGNVQIYNTWLFNAQLTK